MTRPLSTWRVAPLRVCASFNEIGLNSADLNKTCSTKLGRQWASAERPCQACLFPWATSVCGRALERGGEGSRGARTFLPFLSPVHQSMRNTCGIYGRREKVTREKEHLRDIDIQLD
ncbi:hypothetical protein BDP55DRAFT_653409 [Colletotrichum godetiae]|uniref:Uncharacterized protein n=1 Tax=Colletotrichum godetiae TaxID=1209918 RepID=A0AAJ0ATI7_9PEZI|nr:uncharacterized protein BDP55DRAFT_653409 [Colletotrichum godetiae]KAK1689528.1 hypothetical protein BDP55DRAFT_653409 [Colletotrichum godetiae]